ncbi:hypothetical protein M0804_010830 [Polistes exclamans]|nr:hypothetical protein M0804_010830 [Polistes exclamans]
MGWLWEELESQPCGSQCVLRDESRVSARLAEAIGGQQRPAEASSWMHIKHPDRIRAMRLKSRWSWLGIGVDVGVGAEYAGGC